MWGRLVGRRVRRDLVVVLSKAGVSPSTTAIYSAAWKMCVKWGAICREEKGMFSGEGLIAEETSTFLAYMFLSRGNTISTID